jgi:two-component system response regulator PilR (NtrC family)
MAENPPSLRVLIVDDEPLIRWSLSETLADAGHSIAEAGDAESAIRIVTEGSNAFDVVVLDYRLPDSNDLGLLATIRRSSPQSAVIIMTAFGTAEMAQGALALGVYRVVPKPFEVHEMADLVRQAHAPAGA